MMPTLGVIDPIRQFNRFYTRRLGLLDRRFLASPFSLTEVRVLFELAQVERLTATVLGATLGLDAGYLSRILARFARERLVTRQRSSRDGRCWPVLLTTGGRRVFQRLNQRSTDAVARLIHHLSAADRTRLAELLAGVRLLLTPPGEPRPAATLRSLRSGDLGWVVGRHGVLYATEYGWDLSFEALVARIVADYAEAANPRHHAAWIAEIDGFPVGCVFLVRESPAVARLRLLLVEPSARGQGIGRRLVATVIDCARNAGYHKLVLWTNSVLTAARHLYEETGFRLVREEAHRHFGKELLGQDWSLDLR